MERLRPALTAYHMNTLQLIADTLGIEQQKPVHKDRLVDDLYLAIQTLASSGDFIQSLSDAEQQVLTQVVRLNRVCNHRDVSLPLIKQGIVYIRGLDTTTALPSINTVLQSLLSKGLLMNLTQMAPDEDQRQFEPLVNFSVPPEVQAKIKRHLPSVEEVAVSNKVLSTTLPPDIHHGNLEEMLRKLFFVWSELRRKPARLLKSGTIGKRDQRRIATSLGWASDENLPHIQLLYAILKALNLVNISDKTVGAADNHAVTLFWNTSPVDQVREILNAYPQLDYPLVYNTKPLSAFAYYGGFKTRSHIEMRKIILEALEHLATTLWVPYSMLFALSSGGTPGHLVLPPSSLQLFFSALRWYGISRKAELQEQLYDIEQEIVLSVLDEMLILGFIDIGYGKYGNTFPEAVQLSKLLRAHLTQQPWPESQEQGQVILQPDAQLLAMGPVPLRVLANLERVAVREKQDPSVITYRVTREGAYLALQRGETLIDIRGYLEDATGQPLPQNISRSLEEWAEQHERIVVRRDVRILQVASHEVLDRLLRDTIVSRYLHRLDDKTAWIKNKDTAVLEKRLHALEILPARSISREEDLQNSLRWDGELLVSRSPLPSLYVIEVMRLIAEKSGQRPSQFRWKLTEESVRHALTSGYEIVDIIKMVEKMTGTKLPLQWQKKLKAWGKYYGDGYTAQVRLIRLESKQILHELRSTDRNLKEWLQPIPQSEALAVVNPAHWEETLTLLASYGVLVQETEWW